MPGVHDPVGDQTERRADDVKHFAERKIGQPGKTGDKMNIPEDGSAADLIQPDGDRLDDFGRGIAGKGPSGRSMAIQATGPVHLPTGRQKIFIKGRLGVR